MRIVIDVQCELCEARHEVSVYVHPGQFTISEDSRNEIEIKGWREGAGDDWTCPECAKKEDQE
jgi:hypothetical protein